MRCLTSIRLTLLAASLATTAHAETGFYGSLLFGGTEFVRTSPGSYGITERPSHASIAFGYKHIFPSNFALSGEVFYTDREELDPTDVFYVPTALRDQYGASLRIGQQQSRLWTYAILGYAELDYISGNPNEMLSRTGLEYGFGAELSVTPRIALRAEAKTFGDFEDSDSVVSSDQSHAVQYSLGATYYFTAQDELEPADSAEAFAGFYAGLSASGMSMQRDDAFTDGALFQRTVTAYGAFAGYNWQFGNNIIFGGELAIIEPGEDPNVGGGPAFTTDRLTTVSARLGYASGRNMIYLRGGALRIDVSDNSAADPEGSNWGREIGVGVETLIRDRFLVRLEYSYGTFDQPEYEDDPFGEFELEKVTLGVGYKF